MSIQNNENNVPEKNHFKNEFVRLALLENSIKELNKNIVELLTKIEALVLTVRGNGSRESVENSILYRLIMLEQAETKRAAKEEQTKKSTQDIVISVLKMVVYHIITAFIAVFISISFVSRNINTPLYQYSSPNHPNQPSHVKPYDNSNYHVYPQPKPVEGIVP